MHVGEKLKYNGRDVLVLRTNVQFKGCKDGVTVVLPDGVKITFDPSKSRLLNN